MTNQHNLPDKDDAPWLNHAGLSQKEIEDLRKSKKELTEYGKQRLKELMTTQPYDDEIFDVARKRERNNVILQRYNDYYNLECSGLPQGGPLTMEHLQCITLQSAIDAFRCEHLNQEYTHIAIEDIEDLIEGLDRQATRYLERVNELNGEKND